MRWYGWGYEHERFNIQDRPYLMPYILKYLQNDKLPETPPIDFNELVIPPARRNRLFEKSINGLIDKASIHFSDRERVGHAAGRSYYDSYRLRRGTIDAFPDYVIYAKKQSDVEAVVTYALRNNMAVIPFGGGSNVAGALEPIDKQGRSIISLDITPLNKLLTIDLVSLTARMQAGALGIVMERQLSKHGVTLGHFPDSFEHSTLGGWIATRSSGMQSDRYGNIEDMVVSLRMVTPSGTIDIKEVPRASRGPDILQLCIGSEGTYGVIVEAVIRVRPIARHKKIYGFLFPSFYDGIDALRSVRRSSHYPVMTRLSDAERTMFSNSLRKKDTPSRQLRRRLFSKYLTRIKGYASDALSLCLIALESESAKQLRINYSKIHNIYAKFGGVSLGESPGKHFWREKYAFPHLRDFTMDHGILADISETATSWSNLRNLYTKSRAAIADALNIYGPEWWIGCHISHSYSDGASLYFTFACRQHLEAGAEQYFAIKRAAEQAFADNGGTLSHHHAVGLEHSPWLEREISATGISALLGAKQAIDPSNIMNPGKIFRPSHYFDNTETFR